MAKKVLVLNATGKVSARVVSQLVERGERVVAASRNPQSREHTVHFDYADPKTFDAALDGVDRLFWLSPPGIVDGYSVSRPFLTRAIEQVDKVVAMTAEGVQYNEAAPMRQAELAIERSARAYTLLRPSWFMDNFHTFWLAPIKHTGVIPLPAGASRTAFVDARDIADCAVAALSDTRSNGQAYAITGGESLTYAEAAAVLSRASGRTIRYEPVSDAAFTMAMHDAGVPADYTALLTALFGHVREGAAAALSPAVAQLTGHAPRTLTAYAEEHAAAWRA